MNKTETETELVLTETEFYQLCAEAGLRYSVDILPGGHIRTLRPVCLGQDVQVEMRRFAQLLLAKYNITFKVKKDVLCQV